MDYLDILFFVSWALTTGLVFFFVALVVFTILSDHKVENGFLAWLQGDDGGDAS